MMNRFLYIDPESGSMIFSLIIGLISLLILIPVYIFILRLFAKLIDAIINWLNRH